jgi:transcriptional regulator with XRE-family HTH domain
MRSGNLKMRWFERLAAGLSTKGISAAEAGRRLGISGQAVGLKLRGERGVSVDELKALAKMAGLSVAEVVGDDAVVVELEDEKDLIELYRLLTPSQRKMLLGVAAEMAGKLAPSAETE